MCANWTRSLLPCGRRSRPEFEENRGAAPRPYRDGRIAGRPRPGFRADRRFKRREHCPFCPPILRRPPSLAADRPQATTSELFGLARTASSAFSSIAINVPAPRSARDPGVSTSRGRRMTGWKKKKIWCRWPRRGRLDDHLGPRSPPIGLPRHADHGTTYVAGVRSALDVRGRDRCALLGRSRCGRLGRPQCGQNGQARRSNHLCGHGAWSRRALKFSFFLGTPRTGLYAAARKVHAFVTRSHRFGSDPLGVPDIGLAGRFFCGFGAPSTSHVTKGHCRDCQAPGPTLTVPFRNRKATLFARLSSADQRESERSSSCSAGPRSDPSPHIGKVPRSPRGSGLVREREAPARGTTP